MRKQSAWSDYEELVFQQLKVNYSDLNIFKNVKLPGRYSGTLRQVDIYVTGIVGGSLFRKVIDTKYYNKKVDVKTIEEFIGMLIDLDCNQGTLVTNLGTTPAALSRAANNPNRLEIDIVSLRDLSNNETTDGRISYTSDKAITIVAPPGWVVDTNVAGKQYLSLLYPRRFSSIEEAQMNDEFMYCAVEDKRQFESIEKLSKFQMSKYTKAFGRRAVSIEFSSWKGHHKIEFPIRSVYISGKKAIEVTVFLETRKSIFYIVLVAPLTMLNVDFPKLVLVSDNAILVEREPAEG